MKNERLNFSALSPQEIKEITGKKEKPQSQSQLTELLVCPACWEDHREYGRVPPTKTVHLAGSILHDMAFRMHRPLGKEGIRFGTPQKMLAFLEGIYPQKLLEKGDRKLLNFLKSPAFKQFSNEIKAQLLVYYLSNQIITLEAREKEYRTTLGEGEKAFEILAILDQVRKIQIGEFKTKTGEKRKKFKREIWELKREVSEDAFFYYALQTGIELLVYQAKHRRRIQPQIVVYDFSTGDKHLRHGGDEALLVEGIVLAKEAMDLGYNKPNPNHQHYPGFVNRPEKYMRHLDGFGQTVEEEARSKLGEEKYLAALEKFKAYAASCQWEKVESPRRIEQDGQEIKIHDGKNCWDCGQESYYNIKGIRCCSECGVLD